MATPIDNGMFQIGKKVIATLTDDGANLSARQLMQQLKKVGREGSQDTVQFIHNIDGVAQGETVGFFKRINLGIRHFFNKLLGKYKQAADDVVQEGAEQVAKKASDEVAEVTTKKLTKTDIKVVIQKEIDSLKEGLDSATPKAAEAINAKIGVLRQAKELPADQLVPKMERLVANASKKHTGVSGSLLDDAAGRADVMSRLVQSVKKAETLAANAS